MRVSGWETARRMLRYGQNDVRGTNARVIADSGRTVRRNFANPYIVGEPVTRALDLGYNDGNRCRGSGDIIERVCSGIKPVKEIPKNDLS